MTYNEIKLGKIYKYWDSTYYIFIEKGIKEFDYCKYASNWGRWYYGSAPIIQWGTGNPAWETLRLYPIKNNIKHNMLKDMFKGIINK